MAEDRSKTLLEYGTTNVVARGDLFLVARSPNSNPTTNTIAFGSLANCIVTSGTPSNSTSNVVQNVIMYDSNYLYIAANSSHWGRVAISGF